MPRGAAPANYVCVAAAPRLRRAWWLAPCAVYAALLAAHAPLLRLPYYWDEAGYFIPAALDLSRHGWWIPRSTLANGHPPLVLAVLALAWHLAVYSPLVTRATMLLFAAALVWGAERLGRELYPESGGAGAALAALLLAIHPLCFAQATLAQLDLPAAAFIVWALVARARRRPAAYVFCITAAVLAKETALIVPAALAALDLARAWSGGARRAVAAVAPQLVPALALALWLAYFHAATGYWMGNAGFLQFNLSGVLSLPRFAMALYLRVWQLAGYEGMLLLTALAIWGWRRSPTPPAGRDRRREAAVIIAVYLVFHAAIGGAELARYLLPALALYLALAAPCLLRVPRRGLAVLACATLFIAGWFWRPPYPFPYEDNLAYATFVRLHRQAAAYLERQAPTAPVLTAWPATNELANPDLGYVKHSLPVAAVENFTPAGLAGVIPAAGQPVLLYSREYRPRHNWLRWLPFWRRWSRRYFHHQAPVGPQELLERWQLHIEFRAAAHGQWIIIARR
ncbi:MAG: hypothetical protein ACRD2H_15140 [Terriglobales bacterium]